MRTILAPAVTLLIACTGSGGGEPMTGDVTVSIGASTTTMTVGAVVRNRDKPSLMVVQMGDDDVDCGSTLDEYVVTGTTADFVYFSVDRSEPGTHSSVDIHVEKATHDGSLGSSHDVTAIAADFGTVTIDSIGDRVTGQLTLTTEDKNLGAIAVSGSFDIKKCF